MQSKWTREQIIRDILDREAQGLSLKLGDQGVSHTLYQAGSRKFGSWRNAIQAAGISPERVNCGERWSPAKILGMIRHLARHRSPLCVTQLERKYGSMLTAARRMFGSWSKAVIAAGVNPAKFQRVVPWTRERVIEAILTRALRNQAIAARFIQPKSLVEAGQKFFGTWVAAVEAAGMDPNAASVSRAPRLNLPVIVDAEAVHKPRQPWTNEAIIAAIHARLRQQKPMNYCALYRQDRGLHNAGRRHFGNWHNALLAAGLNPDDYRRIPGRKGPFGIAGTPAEPVPKSQAFAAVRPETPT